MAATDAHQECDWRPHPDLVCPLKFQHWLTGQPNNNGGIEHCSQYSNDDEVIDISCDFHRLTVCQRRSFDWNEGDKRSLCNHIQVRVSNSSQFIFGNSIFGWLNLRKFYKVNSFEEQFQTTKKLPCT